MELLMVVSVIIGSFGAFFTLVAFLRSQYESLFRRTTNLVSSFLDMSHTIDEGGLRQKLSKGARLLNLIILCVRVLVFVPVIAFSATMFYLAIFLALEPPIAEMSVIDNVRLLRQLILLNVTCYLTSILGLVLCYPIIVIVSYRIRDVYYVAMDTKFQKKEEFEKAPLEAHIDD